MTGSNDLLTEVMIREREREATAVAARALLLHSAGADRERRHSLRERLGLSLIQAGRALLRHRPTYSPARRRLAA